MNEVKIRGPVLIDALVAKIINVANKTNEPCCTEFNGHILVAKPGDSAETIIANFRSERDRRHEEWLQSPEGQAHQAAQRLIEEEKTKPLKSFSVKDEDAWNRVVEANKDGDGLTIIRYAARWANLMEEKIAAGAKLKDIAQSTESEAVIEGITGFMYYAAVNILSNVWEHGEELRRWNNNKYR